MLYSVIERLIELGQLEGLAHKVDVFYAAGKLTDEEYEALVAMKKDTTWRA